MKKGVEPANQSKAFGGPAKPTAETSTSNKMDIEKPVEPAKQQQEDKNKCYFCKKKTGIYGYQCKCGYTYCKMHRIPEDHECTFDFAAVGRQQLEKNNPLLVGKKLDQL